MQATGRQKRAGFTLIELMIVVAIVGLLAAIAYPLYRDHILKARRSDGLSKLMSVMQAEERYYTEHNTYVTDLTKLGYSSSDSVTSDGGYYTVKAATCSSPYQTTLAGCVNLTATATSKGGQDQDKYPTLQLNSAGKKTPDAVWNS